MWGIVDSLGLKEGLQEFQEQFNKDAKQTIAASQFAKERGIDVQKLDEWQHDLEDKGQEIHERTIGAAVDILAKDETFKQLLEINQDPFEKSKSLDAEAPQDVIAEARETFVPSRPEPTAAPDDAIIATPPAASAVASVAAPVAGMPPSVVARAADLGPSPSADGTVEQGPAVAPAQSRAPMSEQCSAASPADRPRADQRTRHLEKEARELKAAGAAAEAQLAAVRARAAELEARWAELSGVSDDALRRAEEARQQVALLRRSVEEKDLQIAKADHSREHLMSERCRTQRQLEELEASFQERLQREISQKEQELLDEVSYLRKSKDAKDRRLRDLGNEKVELDKQLASADAAGGANREAMLQAHTAIARAFGEMETELPFTRLLDEPLLKFTAALFKQALFRRVFFGASAVMWIFALRQALWPNGDHSLLI